MPIKAVEDNYSSKVIETIFFTSLVSGSNQLNEEYIYSSGIFLKSLKVFFLFMRTLNEEKHKKIYS